MKFNTLKIITKGFTLIRLKLSRMRKILTGKSQEKMLTTFETQGEYPEFNLWNISDFVVRTLIPVVDIRPFPLNELVLLVGAVIQCRPTQIFEWGTNVGVSARVFYETLKSLGWTVPIHSIDLPEDIEHIEHPHAKRGRLVKGLKGVYLHQGDGMNTAIALYASMPDKGRPLFLLDGDHSYESVARELTGIHRAIPEASFIIHDTFLQTKQSNYNIGPHLAVKDFLKKSGSKFIVKEQNFGLPGMTLLLNIKKSNEINGHTKC